MDPVTIVAVLSAASELVKTVGELVAVFLAGWALPQASWAKRDQK